MSAYAEEGLGFSTMQPNRACTLHHTIMAYGTPMIHQHASASQKELSRRHTGNKLLFFSDHYIYIFLKD